MANTLLSMHSEMMAIHSALASLGLARSARSLRKPCFKLPGRGGRRLRLRGLEAYVEAVCAQAEQQQRRREALGSDGDGVGKAGRQVGKWGLQRGRGAGVEDRCCGQGQGGGRLRQERRGGEAGGEGRCADHTGGELWREKPGSEVGSVVSRGSGMWSPLPSRRRCTSATTCG